MKKEFFLAFEEEKNFTPGPSRCVFSTFSVWRLTLLPPKETLWPPHRWLKNNEAQTISIILKTNICFSLHMLDCRVSSKSLIFFCKKNYISGPGDDTSEIFCRVGLDPSYFHTMIALGHISISFIIPEMKKMRNWKRGGTLDIRCRKLSMCDPHAPPPHRRVEMPYLLCRSRSSPQSIFARSFS